MIYAMLCGEWPFTIRSKDLVPERHREVVSNIKASKAWQHATREARRVGGRSTAVYCILQYNTV